MPNRVRDKIHHLKLKAGFDKWRNRTVGGRIDNSRFAPFIAENIVALVKSDRRRRRDVLGGVRRLRFIVQFDDAGNGACARDSVVLRVRKGLDSTFSLRPMVTVSRLDAKQST
jgi:hypothetical protein